jgi:hypothetical protein
MKGSAILLLLLSSLVFSCGTGPIPQEATLAVEQEVPSAPHEANDQVETYGWTAPVETPVITSAEAPEEDVFDPNSISEEVFVAAKKDITALVVQLNRIIRDRNYNTWVTYLSDSYLQEINSRDFLDEKTEELHRRDQVVAQNLGRDPNAVPKRILRTARDYFDYVVVPSRTNDRVDDIGFISETRVRAYTIDERRGQRLVLYDLASINSKWLIVN